MVREEECGPFIIHDLGGDCAGWRTGRTTWPSGDAGGQGHGVGEGGVLR